LGSNEDGSSCHGIGTQPGPPVGGGQLPGSTVGIFAKAGNSLIVQLGTNARLKICC